MQHMAKTEPKRLREPFSSFSAIRQTLISPNPRASHVPSALHGLRPVEIYIFIYLYQKNRLDQAVLPNPLVYAQKGREITPN